MCSAIVAVLVVVALLIGLVIYMINQPPYL
jgi:hypothetical protein